MSRAVAWRRQAGAISILFAVLMLLLVSASLATALRLSGEGLQDAVTNDEQLAALFLAESGIERAHALQTQAYSTGTFAASCQALAGTGPFELGRGRFSYPSATYAATPCSGATGVVAQCCTLSVAAELGESRRTVQAQLETADPNGVAGRGSTTTYLNLKTTLANSAIVTNLAYRAKDAGGSNAVVDECANLGGNSLTGCSELWNLDSGGTYSVNGMGVYAAIPAANARYSIQTRFSTSSGAAVRQYVLTGGLFPPLSASTPVAWRASYFKDATGSPANRTVGNFNASPPTSISVPTGWCLGSATAASEADTLVYGFSSLAGAATGGTPGFMTEVTLGSASNPQASFSRLLQMRGFRDSLLSSNSADYYLYSQIWTLHNPAYTMDAGVTASSSGTLVTLSSTPSKRIRKGTVVSVPGLAATLPPLVSRAKVATDALLVPSGAAMPAVGDAVFGPHVASGTLISGAGVPQADGSTRFPVTPVQKPGTVERPIYLRAAVVADSTTAQFTLSRAPAAALSAAKLCGGLCALFQANAGSAPNTDLTLVGGTAGDGWSTGLTCLSGVNSEGIEIISGPLLRRVAWNEVVR